MGNPISGVDVLLKVNTGTEGSPVWETVAFQRGATLNRSAETIDTSYKGVGAWKSYVAGMKEWSIDADGLYVLGDSGFTALENAFDNRTSIQVEIVDAGGLGFKGTCFITDFPIEAPYDAEMTYSLTLQGNGALTNMTLDEATVEANKITVLALGTLTTAMDLDTVATALTSGATVTINMCDGVVVTASGTMTAGTGLVQFKVVKSGLTAYTPVLQVTVVTP